MLDEPESTLVYFAGVFFAKKKCIFIINVWVWVGVGEGWAGLGVGDSIIGRALDF